MKQLQITLLATVFFATILSCKKGDDNSPEPEQFYRVKKIQNGSEQKNFSYDNESKVTRINFNGGSYRFIYTSTEITAQAYLSNDTPDPTWKYIFTVAGGHITSGRRYLPNGAIGREYQYEYDNQQRLATLVMSLKNFTGDEDEYHRYRFSYDAQNILQQVVFLRKIKTGNTLMNSDSSSATISYFTEKPFINWKQIGFDYWGKASAGIEFQGMETMPFSFTFLENIIPADKAVQLIDTKKYKWNQDSDTWSPASTNNRTYLETDYQHNEKGLLQQYKTNTLEWESYQ